MMAASSNKKPKTDLLMMRSDKEADQESEPVVHIIRNGVRCDTEARGHATPEARPPVKIVVDASEGFIPLWGQDVTLRWRFQERSFRRIANPEGVKTEIEGLIGEMLLAWGNAVPIKFAKSQDVWDFEVVMKSADDCDVNGCVLASAFFPDAGRHKLNVYPKMFTQIRKEQIDTFAHEFGHIFGLRHFFAQITELRWRSEIFGAHNPFSIMNYDNQSELTENDRTDLKRLYEMVWSGQLTEINGTPIRLVYPFHTIQSIDFF